MHRKVHIVLPQVTPSTSSFMVSCMDGYRDAGGTQAVQFIVVPSACAAVIGYTDSHFLRERFAMVFNTP